MKEILHYFSYFLLGNNSYSHGLIQLLFISCCKGTELLYAFSSRSTKVSGTREMLEQYLKAKGIL
jgi:hypothetical protein